MQVKKAISKFVVLLYLIIFILWALSGCQSKEVQYFPLENADDKNILLEYDEQNEEQIVAEAEVEALEENNQQPIYVYVVGAVKQSGVYQLPANSRVFEAIQQAGGVSEEAAVAVINQARFLVDGEKLYIPTLDEAEKASLAATWQEDALLGEVNESVATEGKININTADVNTLTKLSGIGEARAKNIIHYRETNGAFKELQDLMKIDGISTGIFQKIADDITL